MLIFGDIDIKGDWQSANRHSAQIAPDPSTTSEAIIQVYAARTWSWRGAFAVHTWFATKRHHSHRYRVYQVIGWRQYSHLPILSVKYDIPDRYWFGQRPQLLVDLRGAEEINQLIDKLEAAVYDYPYLDEYRTWPGPNSNTFTAFVARQVPQLRLDLPPTAIGKDFLPHGRVFAFSPSGSGGQFSLYGLFGVIVGVEEGLEFNVLTLSFGIDLLGLALRLPGIGRLGF